MGLAGQVASHPLVLPAGTASGAVGRMYCRLSQLRLLRLRLTSHHQPTDLPLLPSQNRHLVRYCDTACSHAD